MTTGKMASVGAESKPPKRKRSKDDTFSFHKCFHNDAWKGLLGMPPDEVGIYWRIILLMYVRRAALAESDVQMAQYCHVSVRTYRNIKARLIERGRIRIDEEHGLTYDERTIHELVDAGFFSEAQTERALRRWAGAKPEDKPKLKVVSNVAPVSPDRAASSLLAIGAADRSGSAVFADDMADDVPDHRADHIAKLSGASEQKQTLGRCRTHASQNPESRESSFERKSSVPGRAAQPPTGGGAPQRQAKLDALTVEERRALIRAQFGESAAAATAEGKDDGRGASSPIAANDEHPPADRIARRR